MNDKARHNQSIQEKMKRSDNCNKNCRFKDEISNKCIHETCLMEELPPTQTDSISVHCWCCGTVTSISSLGFDDNRLCSDCAWKLKDLIMRHDEIIAHITSH